MLHRFVRHSAVLLALVPGLFAHSQSASAVAASARIHATSASLNSRASMASHLPSWATASNDLGALPGSTRLTNLQIILSRSPEVQAAFEQLIADQQNPNSPRYHQWLTPEQNAAQYGIAPADLLAVTDWLKSNGLSVDRVAAGGVFVTFSGSAAAVQTAFAAPIHTFTQDGAQRYSVMTEPTIPAAFSGVIQSVAGLSEVVRSTHIHHTQLATPYSPESVTSADGITPSYTTSGGSHYLAPVDFNTIYDITASQNAGTTGTGYRVANIIDSRIVATDISSYESYFGIGSAVVNQILVTGQSDPGVQSDPEGEADLDVQRIIGTAPGAGVDLLVIYSLSDANIFSALSYEISTLNDASVNMSFGGCNTGTSGKTEASNYETYYQTATAQGISVFNSSGDNGAAGCNGGYSTIPATQVQAANILCMSGYVTCVGGTEFNDATGTYWNSANNTTTKSSALSYIPEGAWNEPGTAGSYDGAGSGGGPGYLPKPTFQTGTGVPADGLRDTPDVAFTAAIHDAYLVCQADISNNCATGSFKYITGGTSASSPSMAGVATLIDQTMGARQGNMNTLLYSLFNKTSAASAIHDVTVATSGVTGCVVTTPSMCNNSTPTSTSLTGGLSGYLVGTGYDEVTGIGSLDVTAFLAAAKATALTATTTTVTATPASIILGSSSVLKATVVSASATGTVQFLANGSNIGSAVTLSGGTASYTYTPPAAGTYSITATYSGDTTYATSTSATAASLSVTNGQFALTAASSALTAYVGTSSTDILTVTSTAPFASAVTLTLSNNTGGCVLSSTSVTPASGGTATATLTCTPTALGAFTVTVTGVSGLATSAVTITGTAGVPFSLSAAPTSLSFTSGATTGNTSTITAARLGSFTGTINLACSITTSNAYYQPTCSLLPQTLASGVTTSVLTIGSTTAVTQAQKSLLQAGGSNWYIAAFMLAFLGMIPFTRRSALRSLRVLPVLVVLGLGAAMISGCGSGGNTVSTPHQTVTNSSAGTYTVTVTGTSATNAAVSASTTVAVTIN